MKVEIGEKIKELRRRDGRTQEDLAIALGVTCQAVSRWETSGCYPDMEILPSIANYFGVSIDTLFGFRSDRDRRINEIMAQVDAYHIKGRSDEEWIEACLGILRDGLAEFPQEERLLLKLADTLCEAGWRRYKEWSYYDEDGYLRHDYDRHKKNSYWTEAIKICESLADSAKETETATESISILVRLYRNFGETEQAVACARRMPNLSRSRELLLAAAADGREQADYIRAALLEMAYEFAKQLIYGLMNCVHNYEDDKPISQIKGAISMFYLICDEDGFGGYHDILISLYQYLSRVQWERGYHDDAFVSLDEALRHGRALETFIGDEGKGSIVKELPQTWPWWHQPDCSQVEKEIKADPRWSAWVEKTNR